MNTNGYCKLCGKIKENFCCQSCYELDATKSTKKRTMQREKMELLEALIELCEVCDAEFSNPTITAKARAIIERTS